MSRIQPNRNRRAVPLRSPSVLLITRCRRPRPRPCLRPAFPAFAATTYATPQSPHRPAARTAPPFRLPWMPTPARRTRRAAASKSARTANARTSTAPTTRTAATARNAATIHASAAEAAPTARRARPAFSVFPYSAFFVNDTMRPGFPKSGHGPKSSGAPRYSSNVRMKTVWLSVRFVRRIPPFCSASANLRPNWA